MLLRRIGFTLNRCRPFIYAKNRCLSTNDRPGTSGIEHCVFEKKSSQFVAFSQNEPCSAESFQDFKQLVSENLTVMEGFITAEEESKISKEVERALSKLKYQYDHWDGVIYGYREIEKSTWTQDSQIILEKMKTAAFDENAVMLPAVHVLDLSKDGYIKPHIDSKFCGSTIAGLSLLSASVMRFIHKDYPAVANILLKPRSLYIMRDRVRYELTHEILCEEESVWKGETVPRDRRISIMLREEP